MSARTCIVAAVTCLGVVVDDFIRSTGIRCWRDYMDGLWITSTSSTISTAVQYRP